MARAFGNTKDRGQPPAARVMRSTSRERRGAPARQAALPKESVSERRWARAAIAVVRNCRLPSGRCNVRRRLGTVSADLEAGEGCVFAEAIGGNFARRFMLIEMGRSCGVECSGDLIRFKKNGRMKEGAIE